MDQDLAYLIKSDSIRLDEERILLVLYYYHQEHEDRPDGSRKGLRDRTFYRCACRVDTRDGWLKLAESISREDPAELFTIDSLGLPDRMKLRSDRIWTRYNASRWLRLKMGRNKIHTLDEFLNGRKTTTGKKPGRRLPGAFETDLPYLEKYTFNGLDFSLRTPYNFPSGQWMVSTRVAPPRKKPKVITD